MAGAPSSESGSASQVTSLSFSPTQSGAATISYNFANDLFVFTSGGGNAVGSYSFDVTIKDAAGNVVFDLATSTTNLSLAAPPPGGELIRSGTETLTTPALAAGTYTIILSSTAQSSVSPDPSSFVLVGCALLGLTVRRRRD